MGTSFKETCFPMVYPDCCMFSSYIYPDVTIKLLQKFKIKVISIFPQRTEFVDEEEEDVWSLNFYSLQNNWVSKGGPSVGTRKWRMRKILFFKIRWTNNLENANSLIRQMYRTVYIKRYLIMLQHSEDYCLLTNKCI